MYLLRHSRASVVETNLAKHKDNTASNVIILNTVPLTSTALLEFEYVTSN